MQTVVIQNEHTEAPPSAAVMAAAVTRRYGEGDTAVDALLGVSISPTPSRADSGTRKR